MDFIFSEEHKMLQTAVRQLAGEKLAPAADDLDRKQEFARQNFRELAKMGLLGLTIPPEYGGSGGDELSVVIAVEEIARACAATADIVDAHLSLCAAPLYRYGNEEQRRRFVPPLARGDKVGSYSLTEPEAGSDVANAKATAARDGEDYVLNGTKIFITNGDVCNLTLVLASIPDLKRGATAFIVEEGTPGYSKGKKYDKLGIRGATNADQVFVDCRVPRANRLGDEGQGLRIFLEILDHGRLGIAAQAIGITQAVLDKAVQYSKERIQFGAPIGQNQGVSWKLAEIATELEAARLLTYKAAFLASQGMPFRTQAAMAKLYAAELAMRAATFGIQVYGGYGYMMDSPMQRYFRDAKITSIYEGTSEVQHLVIARDLYK